MPGDTSATQTSPEGEAATPPAPHGDVIARPAPEDTVATLPDNVPKNSTLQGETGLPSTPPVRSPDSEPENQVLANQVSPPPFTASPLHQTSPASNHQGVRENHVVSLE